MRDLRRRERHDIEILIVAVTAVENVKIAAGGPHDDYFPTHPYLPRQAGEYLILIPLKAVQPLRPQTGSRIYRACAKCPANLAPALTVSRANISASVLLLE
jgi:hypothetical protein